MYRFVFYVNIICLPCLKPLSKGNIGTYLHNIVMCEAFCSYTIARKSATVCSSGPWVAMYSGIMLLSATSASPCGP